MCLSYVQQLYDVNNNVISNHNLIFKGPRDICIQQCRCKSKKICEYIRMLISAHMTTDTSECWSLHTWQRIPVDADLRAHSSGYQWMLISALMAADTSGCWSPRAWQRITVDADIRPYGNGYQRTDLRCMQKQIFGSFPVYIICLRRNFNIHNKA